MKTLITITGKSCSGKSTLEADLAVERDFHKATSHTTRLPRAGEVNGVDYYFVEPEEFQKLAISGAFIETSYSNGRAYGISKYEIDNLADLHPAPIVLVVDPKGHQQICDWMDVNEEWRHISIFLYIDAPTQCKRFIKRSIPDLLGADSTKIADVAKRMAVMMTVEKDWELCAEDPEFFLMSYDAENKEEILDAIVALVNEDYFSVP